MILARTCPQPALPALLVCVEQRLQHGCTAVQLAPHGTLLLHHRASAHQPVHVMLPVQAAQASWCIWHVLQEHEPPALHITRATPPSYQPAYHAACDGSGAVNFYIDL